MRKSHAAVFATIIILCVIAPSVPGYTQQIFDADVILKSNLQVQIAALNSSLSSLQGSLFGTQTKTFCAPAIPAPILEDSIFLPDKSRELATDTLSAKRAALELINLRKVEKLAEKLAARAEVEAAKAQRKEAEQKAGAIAKDRKTKLVQTMRKDPRAALQAVLAVDDQNALTELTSNCVEQLQDVAGEVEVLHIEHGFERSENRVFLKTASGESVELHAPSIDEKVEPKSKIRVRGYRIDNEILFADAPISAIGQETGFEAQGPSVQFADNPQSGTTGIKKALVVNPGSGSKEAVQQAGQLFNQWSGGKLTISVVDTVQIPISNCGSDVTRVQNDIQAKGIDYLQYRFILINLSGLGCGGSAWAFVNGTVSWYSGSGIGQRVVAHELGHNLGLYHAKSQSCLFPGVCSFSEYGDTYDTMGLGSGMYNAASLLRLSWLNPDQITDVSEGGSYSMSTLDSTAGVKVIRVKRSVPNLDYTFFEFRKQSGATAVLPHVIAQSQGGTFLVPPYPLTPSKIFQDPAGNFTARFGQLLSGSSIAPVQITFGSPDVTPPTGVFSYRSSGGGYYLKIEPSDASGIAIVEFKRSNGTSLTQKIRLSGPFELFFNASQVTGSSFYAELTDNAGNVGVSNTITIGTAVNTKPVVFAGNDQTVATLSNISLIGSVSDDGLPNPPGATTKTWIKVSGPGTATFSNPSSAITNVTFSQSGTYVLRLTANDSQLSDSDDVTIRADSAPPPPTPDRTRPTVTITSPLNKAVVSGLVTLTVEANDNVGVDRVIFYRGSLSNVFATVTNPPYTATYDTTSINKGSLTLSVRAYDKAGNYAADSVPLIVDNSADTTKPSVSITEPPANSLLSGPNVSVIAEATDNIDVTNVAFFLDGSTSPFAETTDAASTFEVNLDTTLVSDGPHSLSAKAYDTAGNAGTSASLPVKVDNTPPTVSVTSPSDGTTVSGNITLAAQATDVNGIASVDLGYISSTTLAFVRLATDTVAPFSTSVNTQTLPNGPVQFVAKAIDKADNEITSIPVTVTINNISSNLPPTVNAGPDKTTNLGSSVSLSGSASDDGLPSGSLTILWSKVSGPGSVSFSHPASLNTTATFGSAGTYVLELTASDGALTSADTVTVTVNPDTTISTLSIGNFARSFYIFGTNAKSQTMAQSFVATGNAVKNLSVTLLRRGTPDYDILVAVRSSLNGPVIGEQGIIRHTESISTQRKSPTEVTVAFPSPIPVTPNATYFVTFTTAKVNAKASYSLAVDTFNAYSGGTMYKNNVLQKKSDVFMKINFAGGALAYGDATVTEVNIRTGLAATLLPMMQTLQRTIHDLFGGLGF